MNASKSNSAKSGGTRGKLLTTALLALLITTLVHGQTPIVASATAPSTGPYDIANFNSTGSPANNQDYTNNPPPGQTFTTLGNAGGYLLNSVVVQGVNNAGGIYAGLPFTLTVYAVSGSTLTSIGSEEYTFTTVPSGYATDYLILNLTHPIALAPNTTYAFTFGNTPDGTGSLTNPSSWYGMTESSGDVYAGGAAFNAVIPGVSGGNTTILAGPYGYDRSFDIGLSLNSITPNGDIAPMTWTQRSDWINVQSCSSITGGPNAVGNGTVDDTAAIQGALTYLTNHSNGKYSTIYFPPGNYKITSMLTLTGMYWGQLIGCGGYTTIKWGGATGGAMFNPRGCEYMHYWGLDWDGGGNTSGTTGASCAFFLDWEGQGEYETGTRHENECFKNFTATGSYTYTDNNMIQHTSGAPASGLITGFGYGLSADMNISNCRFSNCANGAYVGFTTTQVYQWHLDRCEFDNCGVGFNSGNGDDNVIINSHFQGSTLSDVYAGRGLRLRHCTSHGSASFLIGVQGNNLMQDCWIDGWTNPASPVQLTWVGSHTIFDCNFTNPPAGAAAPIRSENFANPEDLILSNNYAPAFTGGNGIINSDSGLANNVDFIPPGIRTGTVTGPTQTFLNLTPFVDSTHIIDVTLAPYSVDSTGTTDCTTQVQAALTAAKNANNGSIVYFPAGYFKTSSTLATSGSNFGIQGSGGRSFLYYDGAVGGTMMTLANPVNVTVQNMAFVAQSADASSIGLKETATTTSNVIYDGLYYYTINAPGSGIGENDINPGLVLSSLPASATVYIPFLQAPLTVQNSGAAQILGRSFLNGEINVSGTGAKTGFLGIMDVENGEQADPNGYAISVTDNQNLVIGDHYTESDYNDIHLSAGSGTTAGHFAIQGENDAAWNSGLLLNASNYLGRAYLSSYYAQVTNSGGAWTPVQITQTGTNAIDLMVVGINTYDFTPTISLGSGANAIETDNWINTTSGAAVDIPDSPNPLTATSYLKLSQGLDDIRQLGAVDMQVQFGVTADAPPVAAYEMEQSVVDFTNTYNGTNSGATYSDGAVGSYAAQFNGTSAYIKINKPVSASFSIAMWVKTTDIGATGQWRLGRGLVDGTTGTNTADFGTALNAGKFSLGIGNPDTTLTSTTAINDGNWHHVVGTWNSTSGAMQVYVDGVLNTSGSGPTGTRSAPTYLRIGSIQTGASGGFFKGAIDQVHICNYVVSASDVSYLYNRNQVQLPISSGLVAHWKLDETTGTTSADTSGNGINGTWTNSPVYSSTKPVGLAFTDVGGLAFSSASSQYVNMGNPAALPSGTAPRTICGWAKCGGLSGYGMFASYGTPATHEGFWIGGNGTALSAGSWGDDMPDIPGFWDGNWHFIALTYDGTTARLYADGALKESAAKSWNLVHDVCYVGCYLNGADFWTGNVDDVRIYNRALSAAEIAQLSAGHP